MHRPFWVAITLLSFGALAQLPVGVDAGASRIDGFPVTLQPGTTLGKVTEQSKASFSFPVGDSLDKVSSKAIKGKLTTAELSFQAGSICTEIIRKYRSTLWDSGLEIHTGKNRPLPDISWERSSWLSAEGRVRGSDTELFILLTCEQGNAPVGRLWAVQTALTADAMATEIEKTGRISLYAITFTLNRADISPESAKTLDEVGKLLAAKTDWKIRVGGHTDDRGNPKLNLALSLARAEAVKIHLVNNFKIDPERITTVGLGDTKPLDTSGSPEGRAKNRRVELSKL